MLAEDTKMKLFSTPIALYKLGLMSLANN